MSELVEGIHYYLNDDGLIVLTEQYHLDKGYCCGCGCKHCPYNYENVPEPKRTELKPLHPDSYRDPRGAYETPE